MKALQRPHRLPASIQYIRTRNEATKTHAAIMCTKRTVVIVLMPGTMTKGSAMYAPVRVSTTMHVKVTQCVTRTGTSQTRTRTRRSTVRTDFLSRAAGPVGGAATPSVCMDVMVRSSDDPDRHGRAGGRVVDMHGAGHARIERVDR